MTFFNPMFEFVHIRPKIGLKQPSIFLERKDIWKVFFYSFSHPSKK